MLADKYCGGCGVTLTAQAEEARETTCGVPAGGNYSAAEIRELTDFCSDVRKSKAKTKTGADEEQISQDAINEMFDSKNEE